MPDLLRGTWHGVLRYCKLKECGDRIRRIACYPVFKDRASPSESRYRPRTRSLSVAESRRQPLCIKRGSGSTSTSRLRQEGFVETELAVLPNFGVRLLPQDPASRQEGFADSLSRYGVPPEWALLLLPLSEPRQAGNRTARSRFPLDEGRCFYPFVGGPVNQVPEEGRCFLPGLRRRGA